MTFFDGIRLTPYQQREMKHLLDMNVSIPLGTLLSMLAVEATIQSGVQLLFDAAPLVGGLVGVLAMVGFILCCSVLRRRSDQ